MSQNKNLLTTFRVDTPHQSHLLEINGVDLQIKHETSVLCTLRDECIQTV